MLYNVTVKAIKITGVTCFQGFNCCLNSFSQPWRIVCSWCLKHVYRCEVSLIVGKNCFILQIAPKVHWFLEYSKKVRRCYPICYLIDGIFEMSLFLDTYYKTYLLCVNSCPLERTDRNTFENHRKLWSVKFCCHLCIIFE